MTPVHHVTKTSFDFAKDKPRCGILFFALSAGSGFLSGLSFNHPALSFLVWFSLTPLFLVMTKSTPRQTFFYFYLAGFTFFLTVVSWVGFVTKLGLFLLVFYLAFYWAIFGILAQRSVRLHKSPLIVAFAWIILEWLRTNFGGFGWALLGYSQYKFGLLIQSASLCGAWIVSFIIVYCNAFLFNIVSKKDKAAIFKQSLFLVFLSIFILAYGVFSFSPRPKAEGLKVAVIQPNIPQYKKWDAAYHRQIKDTLLRLTKEAGVDSLVILPEASWPYSVDSQNIIDLVDFVREASRDMIIGVVEKNESFYNSSFFFLKGGLLLDRYRKINLVPFGEFIPFRNFLGFIEEVSAFGDISAGSVHTVFSYRDSKIAALICFEDIFPALVSSFVKKGASVLVNITNDAWFNGHPEARQHLQSAVFRAVEQRRFLVRAANTGVSCVISPRGRVVKSLAAGSKDVFVEGVLAGEVFPIENRSVYNRLGDVLVYIGFAVCLLGLWRQKCIGS